MSHPPFTASVISGAKRGKRLGTPTLNLERTEVPGDLPEGIYACFAMIDGHFEPAVMHHGPRPVFADTPSTEVHLLDRTVHLAPDTLTVLPIHRLRDVENFPSIQALQRQIAEDIAASRAILSEHGDPHSQASHP